MNVTVAVGRLVCWVCVCVCVCGGGGGGGGVLFMLGIVDR